MPSQEAEDLIHGIADAAARLIESNIALARRVLRGTDGPDDAEPAPGPVEDAWLTWADGAGDLVTLSYLSAQLADVLGVYPRRSPRDAGDDD